MEYELKWAVVALVWTFMWLAFVLLSRELQERKRLRYRRIAQEERTLALEKGVPLPEIPSIEPEEEGGGFSRWRRFLRRDSLASGLLLSFLGIGIGLACFFSGEGNLRDLWSLGFVPLMAGAGLLLHHALQGRHRLAQ
jgi:hypothetical protein